MTNKKFIKVDSHFQRKGRVFCKRPPFNSIDWANESTKLYLVNYRLQKRLLFFLPLESVQFELALNSIHIRPPPFLVKN